MITPGGRAASLTVGGVVCAGAQAAGSALIRASAVM